MSEYEDLIQQNGLNSALQQLAAYRELRDSQQKARISQPDAFTVPSSKDIGAIATGFQQAKEAILPAAGGLAGGLAAAGATATALGPAAATLPGVIGVIAAGTLGSMAGSWGGEAAREGFEHATMNDEQYQAYKEDLMRNAKNHPVAAWIGNLAPNLAVMGISPKNVGAAFQTAKEVAAAKNGVGYIEELLKTPVGKEAVYNMLGVAVSTGTAAGQDIVNQLGSGENFNALEFGANVAAGALMNKPSSIAEYIGSKIPGPAGEILQRSVLRDRSQQAESLRVNSEKALNMKLDDLSSTIAQIYTDQRLTEQQRNDYVTNALKQSGLEDLDAAAKTDRAIVEAAIKKQQGAQIQEANRMLDEEIGRIKTGNAQLDEVTKNIKPTGFEQGGAAATLPDKSAYIWGQDETRDTAKRFLGREIIQKQAALRNAINGGEAPFRKNQLASEIDGLIRDYHNIGSQTWQERMAEQAIPGQIQEGIRRQIQARGAESRKVNTFVEIEQAKEAHKQLVSDIKNAGPSLARAARPEDIVATDKINNQPRNVQEEIQRFRERQSQSLNLSPEADAAMKGAVDELKNLEKLAASKGKYFEATEVRKRLDKINQTNNPLERVRLLKEILPNDKRVVALDEAVNHYKLVGNKNDLELQYQNYTNPELAQQVGARLANDKGLGLRTAFVDSLAPLEKLDPESRQLLSNAQSREQGLNLIAERAIKHEHEKLAKSAELTGQKIDFVKAEADRYTNALSDLEHNKNHWDGASGRKNKELQRIIKEVEQNNSFKAIHDYQQTLARLGNENLDMAGGLGKINGDVYNFLKQNNPNYVPARETTGDMVWQKRKPKDITAAQPIKEITGGGVRNRMAPDEAILRQRMALASESYKYSMFKTLREASQTNKELASVLHFTDTPREGAKNLLTYELADGKKVYIEVGSDLLYRSLQGLDKETLPPSLQAVAKVTQMISAMAVRFSPRFWLNGLAYDAQGALQNIGTTPISKFRGEFIRNYTAMIKPALEYYTKAGKMGTAAKGQSAEMIQWIERATKAGAVPGGLIQSPNKTVQASMASAARDARGGATSLLFNALHDIAGVNEGLMMATRVGAYKTAIEAGLSESKAVESALNIGPNYNTTGNFGRTIGAFKAFTTASIAGADRFAKSFIVNGKLDGKRVASFIGGSIAANMALRAYNDSVDKDWKEKWGAERNWVFAINPTTAIAIPMEWAQRPIHFLTGKMVDSQSGSGSFNKEDVGKLASMVTEAYTPFTGQGASALIPTALQAPAEIWANKDYTGKPIVSRGLETRIKEGLPPHLAYYDDINKTLLGGVALQTSDALSSIGAELTPKQVQYFFQQWFSAPANFAQGRPMGSFFLKTLTPERAQQISDESLQTKIEALQKGDNEQQAIQKFEDRKQIEAVAKDLQSMPIEQQKSIILTMAGSSPEGYAMAYELNQYLRHQAIGQFAKMSKPKEKE